MCESCGNSYVIGRSPLTEGGRRGSASAWVCSSKVSSLPFLRKHCANKKGRQSLDCRPVAPPLTEDLISGKVGEVGVSGIEPACESFQAPPRDHRPPQPQSPALARGFLLHFNTMRWPSAIAARRCSASTGSRRWRGRAAWWERRTFSRRRCRCARRLPGGQAPNPASRR